MRASAGRHATGEILLPFPTPLREATQFKTTWLASSLSSMRELGLMDRYLELLPKQHHETVLTCVVGSWVPTHVALAHYNACDQLGLPNDQILQIGRAVTNRVHGTTLSLFVRMAKQSGVTPWVALVQLNRLWERVWDGGGVQIRKLGPKDALVELAGWPPAHSSYVRTAMPAVTGALLDLFCRRTYPKVATLPARNTMHIEVSWV